MNKQELTDCIFSATTGSAGPEKSTHRLVETESSF